MNLLTSTSPKWRLDLADGIKSFLVAALGQPILVILTSLSQMQFHINWTEQWHLAVSAAAAYLIKNLCSKPPK